MSRYKKRANLLTIKNKLNLNLYKQLKIYQKTNEKKEREKTKKTMNNLTKCRIK